MAIGSGAIGQFAIGQGTTLFYSLTATGLATGSPVLGTPALSHAYSATASNLTTGSPSLGAPAAAVNFALTANDFAPASPVLGAPGLFLVLAPADLATGSPELGTPTAAVLYNLTASALATGSPEFGAPALSHAYSATASDLTAGSPALGGPAVGNIQALDLVTEGPELDTPPYSPCILGIDLYVTLLLHGDGSNGSTTIVDSAPSAHTMTANNGAALTTTSPQFGSACMTFDGTNDYIDTPDSSDFTLGSGNFTIDFWFNTGGAGNGTTRRVCGHASSTGGGSDSAWHFTLGASNTLGFNLSNGGFVAVLGTTAITAAGWHHAAGVRTGNTLKFFLDGVQEGGDVTFSSTAIDSAGNLALGRRGSQNAQYFPGQIDEFRFSVGLARWTANFTPPTFAYGYCCAAANFAPASPALDTPTLSHAYAATASDLTTGSPALGSPALSYHYAATASDLVTGSPAFGAPALSHHYAPTPSALVTASPALDTPALMLPLLATDLATGSPVLDAPEAAVFYPLTAVDLAPGSPALGTPVLSHAYSLAASDLETASPEFGAPSLSHAYAVTASDYAPASPVLDTPTLSQAYSLTAANLATGSPVLEAPAAAVFYPLVASALATGSPELGEPSLTFPDQYPVLGLTTGSPEIGTPSVTVFYALTAAGLATGSPALDAPPLSVGLLAEDLETGSPVLDTPAFVPTVVALDLTTGSPDLGAPVLVTQDPLVALPLTTETPDLDTPAATVHYNNLIAEDLETEAPELGTPPYGVPLVADDPVVASPQLGAPVCTFFAMPRAENLIDLSASLLDPIYASLIAAPARLLPPFGAPLDVTVINHTSGVEALPFGVNTVRPAVDVRLSELATHGISRAGLIGGQVVLYPDTDEEEVWGIESIANRPGIWGEGSGELRLFLMDPVSVAPVAAPNDYDILLDPIYASVIAHPARIFPGAGALAFLDLLCINHTEGIEAFDEALGINTIRPHVDVRVKELALYGVARQDLNGGQVMLWPNDPRQEMWAIEDVAVRAGFRGERFGELRIFLMDRQA